MNIVFLGTPQFAVPSLDILYRNGYPISAVVTAPGKPAGRGLVIRESPIKKYAEEQGLKTFQPTKLSDPDFLLQISDLKPDLMVVVAFRMMPESLWSIPSMGTFNLHGSLLPQYRGAAPINRAIINGESETGLTTFFLKHEIDTGNIIFRERVTIDSNETAGELHDKMMIVGADLVLKTVKEIASGTVKVVHQSELLAPGELLKPAPKIFADDCLIHWNKSAPEIHNLVRGLSPFPGAFTYLTDNTGNKINLKIFRTLLFESKQIDPGTILVENGKLIIGCLHGAVEVLELQQEGKKRMNAADFLRGFRVEKGWKAVSIN